MDNVNTETGRWIIIYYPRSLRVIYGRPAAGRHVNYEDQATDRICDQMPATSISVQSQMTVNNGRRSTELWSFDLPRAVVRRGRCR